MKISWPKGMERWKAVLDRYRYALLVIAVGVLLLLLPTGSPAPRAEEERAGRGGVFPAGGAGGEAGSARCPTSRERERRRSC
ncbi:MAG: hypothetical protein ACLUJG_08285 [Lawsonibacter sp.]